MARDTEDRELLGALAGAVLGAKRGADESHKHPIFGALGGAFVGGVGGSFVADLVNAAVSMSERQSAAGEEESGEEGQEEDIARSLRLAELKGYADGFAFGMATSKFLFKEFELLFEELATNPRFCSLTLAQLDTLDSVDEQDSGALMVNLLLENKEEIRKEAEAELLDTYSRFDKHFKSRGIEVGLDVLSARDELRSSMDLMFKAFAATIGKK